MKTITLDVPDMTCKMCVAHVTEALESLDGATDVRVDRAIGKAVVSGVEREAAEAAVREAGYTVA